MGHDDAITLLVDPAVGETLEQRGIREEDIRQVVAVAQAGRRFHVQTATGRRLASFTPDRVTYWVEYGQEEGGCRIFAAYSHRMRILEGFNLPSNKEPVETGWVCGACDVPLALATVKLKYLDETFAVDLPACPTCQRVLITEEQAVVKMAMAERMLEDK
jgi:hypothetical protein